MIYFWPTHNGFAATDNPNRIPEEISRSVEIGGMPMPRRYRLAATAQEFQDYIERECVPVTVQYDLRPPAN